MKRLVLIMSGMLLCVFAALAVAQPNRTTTPDALMLRFPDVSADQIVFVYAGDWWTAPKPLG